MNTAAKITQPSPSLLVVDDDPQLRFATVRPLKQAGYTVLEGATAAEALALTRAHRPALVLLDVVLPDGDGREVAWQLKIDPDLVGVFVVLVSGIKVSPEDQAMGLSEGLADGYILRPVSAPVLLGWVDAFLRLRATQEALREKEERLRQVLENSLDASYRRNLQTNAYDYFSPVFARLSGYTSDEMKRLPLETVLGLMHPDDLAEVERVMTESMSGAAGTAYHVDYRFKHKDGQYRWFHDQFTVMRDAPGQPVALIGSVSDITDRKQAEVALRESEERLQRAESVAHFGNWELDLAKRKIRASAGARAIYGLPGAEWALADVQSLPLPEYRAMMDAALTHLIEHHHPYNIEFRIRRPSDGQGRDIQSMAEYDPDRGVVFGVINDITERKRAEEALRQSEEKYNLMVTNIADVIAIMGPDGLMKYKSPNLEKFFGWRPEDLVGADGWHTVHPADLERIRTEFLALLEKDHLAKTVEYRYKCKDNRYKWIELTAVNLVNDPLIKGVLMNYRDITERKQAEVALRESEAKFRALIEQSSEGVILVDEQGYIVAWNGAQEQLTGILRAEAVGQPVWDIQLRLVSTARRAQVTAGWLEQNLRQVLDTGQPSLFGRQVEISIETASGESKTILQNTFPIRTDKGYRLGVITYDVTERKQAEAAQAKLKAQNQQLEKAESLGRMAGAVAHHFNNQLQVVMGRLELAMSTHLPPRQTPDKNLAQAMLAAHRAAEMSSLMLVYLGQTQDTLEPLELAGICVGNLAPLRETIPPGVTLMTNWPNPGPVIKANASRIQQLLTNLVTNAWEAIDDGQGTITLTVNTVSPADIPTSSRFPLEWQPQEQAYACLEVTDTGAGIAAEDIEKLFDPFYSTKFAGRGLGLAVVLGIVRGHSGAVTVESQPGRGSTFRLFFPMIAQVVPPQPPDSVAHSLAMERDRAAAATVLLVEDDNLVRLMVAEMLTDLGFTVLTAADGAAAVELFRQRQADIDCVLSDLTMPRMDGWETLTALRQIAPDLPVILSSGYDEAQVMAGHHPDDRPQSFLSKPYQIAALRNALTRAMAK